MPLLQEAHEFGRTDGLCGRARIELWPQLDREVRFVGLVEPRRCPARGLIFIRVAERARPAFEIHAFGEQALSRELRKTARVEREAESLLVARYRPVDQRRDLRAVR